MMVLNLYAGGNPAGQLELPVPPRELERKMEQFENRAADALVVQNVDSVIPGLGWHLQYTKLNSGDVLQKLNHLAEIIDGMDAAGLHHLTKALSTDYQQPLSAILRAAACMERQEGYELIPDVTTDCGLGNWLVEQGRFEIPERLLPHLNYESVGREYRLEHDGIFLSSGYAGVQPGAMEQTLEEPGIIQLTLSASRTEHRLYLPASDEQMERARQALGVDGLAQANISAVTFAASQLAGLIPLGGITAEEANTLALCLREMKLEDGNIKKYCAALEVENPSTFSEAVTIAMDCDDYELVPEDMDEYGKEVLRRAGADDEVIDTIDGYMDFARLGEDSLEEDGVRRTESGLIRRISAPFPAEAMGQTMC